MTIEQLEAFSNTKPELRYITEEIIKYLGANPGGSSPGGSSYLVYTALLSQSGTDAPVVTVLQNTIDPDIAWTRLVLGRYNATSIAGFATGTVVCPPFDNGGAVTLPLGNNTPIDDFYSMKKTTDTTVTLEVVDVDYNLVELSAITSNSLFVEIRVYP